MTTGCFSLREALLRFACSRDSFLNLINHFETKATFTVAGAVLLLGLSAGCGGGMHMPTTTTLTLSGSSFDFGEDLVGNKITQTVVKVTNSGGYTATLSPALSGDSSFSIVTAQSCGAQLPAGASCNLVVSYLPTTASAPMAQTTTLSLNASNVTASPATVSITGTSGQLAAGTVTATGNPQVAQYTITPPFSATVTISFGTTTSYGLQTSSKATPSGGGPVSIYVAGMRGNTLYHMQASIQFDNGMTATDVDQTFTTSSYPANLMPNLTTTTTAGATPQPGIEMLNPASQNVLELFSTDLAGNVIWAYQPPDLAPFSTQSAIVAPKLLPNGDILLVIEANSTAPLSGPIPSSTLIVDREIDLAGNTVKQISLADLNTRLAAATCAECSNLTLQTFHHDVTPLPNGHWIVLANVLKQVTLTGQTTPTTVLGDVVVDLDQNMNPVWVWNEFNHLDVNRHPYSFPDWTHTNAVVYSPDDGNLLISIRHQSWVVKVDYQNGAGTGNILWRLGYQGDFTLQGGTDPTDWFYAQHAPSFTTSNTAGVFGLTLMDNGDDRIFPSGTTCGTGSAPPCYYSTVPVFQINENAKTATLQFHAMPNLYSNFGGNAEQLANGNLEYDLCGLGFGTSDPHSEVDELTQTGTPQIVWQMKLDKAYFYRAFRIPSLYPGVQW